MIEFQCPHCTSVLRTADDKAGRRARCPDCGEAVDVPGEQWAAAADAFEDPNRSASPLDWDFFDDARVTSAGRRPATPKSTGRTTTCPMCGIAVDVAAVECPGCGNELHPVSTAPTLFEERTYQPQFAGFWLRFVAYVIDSLVLGIPLGILMYFAFHNQNVDPEFVMEYIGVFEAGVFVLVWPYFAIMESSSKCGTIGKQVVGIAVVDMAGRRITFARASGRHFGKLISSTCLAAGYIAAGISRKKQGWHDMMSECLVVRREDAVD